MKFIAKVLFVLLFFSMSSNSFSQIIESNEEENIIYNHLEKAKDLERRLDFDEALVFCNQALTLSKEIGSKEYEAKSYQLTGNVYLQSKQYQKALIELQNAYRIQKNNELLKDLAKTQNILGLTHTELKNFSQAENYFESALLLYKKLQLNSSKTSVFKNKGKLYLKKKAYKEANKAFIEAYKLADKFALEATKAEILLNNAKALNHLNEPEKAISVVKKAMRIGESNSFNWVIIEGYRTISEIYESDKQYKKAYENIQLHNAFRNSIYTINKERLTAEESAKLNFADQDRLLEQQQLIIQKNKEQFKQNKTIIALAVATSILFLLFLGFLYFSNHKRKKANKLLSTTNEQLINAKEEAELATKAKASFLSTITHELRTPLYSVTGLTDLLLEESPTPAQEGYLKSLRFSGDYLLNFINDILDVNKIEANKIELENIPFNLKTHTKKVLNTLSKLALDNETELKFIFNDDVPKTVIGDSLRLSQILINLISNAIKFTEKGEVTLKISNKRTLVHHTTLLFEVIDTGIGISYEKQKTIFERFSQGSVQINRKYGGTGLGLTIVKNLLKLMDSKIKLKSIPKHGATFYFEIIFEITQENIVESKVALSENEINKLAGKTILLVEDVKINQLITKKTIERKNIICITANNGEEAVIKAKTQKIDLILMDLHLPGISGIAATKQIRSFNPKIPIIALTALTIGDQEREEFNSAGFNGILSKPFKNELFFEKIYTLIENT